MSKTISVVEARLRGAGTVTKPPTCPVSWRPLPAVGTSSTDHRVPDTDPGTVDSSSLDVSYHGVAVLCCGNDFVESNGSTGSASRTPTLQLLDHQAPTQAPFQDIFGPRDDRLIVWEIHRATDDDMRVIEFNPTLTACVASNATVSMLGDKTQAKAVVHYMVKYMTKDSTSLNNVLPLIWEAQKTTVKYGSTAPDKAESSRVFKFLMTRILNNLSGRQEISASQAASALMGYGSTMSSSGFWLCYHEPARRQMMEDLGFDPVERPDSSNIDWDETSESDSVESNSESCETVLDMEPDDSDCDMSRDSIESTIQRPTSAYLHGEPAGDARHELAAASLLGSDSEQQLELERVRQAMLIDAGLLDPPDLR